MTQTSTEVEGELAERLLWWLAAGGLLCGLADVVLFVGQVLARPGLVRDIILSWTSPGDWRDRLESFAFVTWWVQPPLLIIGSLALWRRKSSAKPILLSYAGLRFAAGLLIVARSLYDSIRVAGQLSLLARIEWAMHSIHEALINCIFAAVLFVCLTRLRLPQRARRPGGGFEPVMPPGV